MAIAFQSATNAALTGATLTQTTLAINKPTSTASGDLLVHCMSYIQGQTVTTLSGWTLVSTVNGTTGVTVAVYYRVADGSEGSTFTWTFTTTSGASLVAMTCLRFTGTNATPLGTTATATGGSITTKTPGTLTGAAATSVGIIACGVRPDVSGNPVLSTPSTSNWVADANAKTVSTVSATSFNAAVGVSYNLSTASAAPPACTTTTACEYGILSVEFTQASTFTPPAPALVVNSAALARSYNW
jgi:hypothetical protein